MKIINSTKQTILSENAQMADTPFSRIKGLLGRAALERGEALVITHCRSIHMFFMKFAIDAIFVDRKHRVVGIVENIKPFRMSPYFLFSSYVIEIPVGKIKESLTEKGDEIVIER